MIISLFVACVSWFLIFSPLTRGIFNLWVAMSIATVILAALSLFLQVGSSKQIFSSGKKHIIYGVLSAALLYVIFFIGDALSKKTLPFAGEQIRAIYATKTGTPDLLIAVLIFFCIAPSEEIFWRGYIQNKFCRFFGPNKGYILAALLYSVIHVFSLNYMLVLAALICGLVWGALYKICRSIWPAIISHVLFDLTIFILFPVK